MALDKSTLKYAIDKMEDYITLWDDRYKIYEIKHNEKIPDIWSVILITTEKKFLVSDSSDIEETSKLILSDKKIMLKYLQNYEDINYKIYYKQIEQRLIGYWLDFFIYYVDMPDKIITENDDNFELYDKIKHQKIK